MKTKNKIISIFMCLCLALLSGCSQDSGGEPDAGAAGTVNTSSAGNTNKEESGSTTANTESNAADTSSEEAEVTEAEETEPEKPTVDERFAYYVLLSEEYKKSGRLYAMDEYSDDCIITDTGKIFFDVGNNAGVKVYDPDKKAIIAELDISFFDQRCPMYLDDDNGYFYIPTYISGSPTLMSKYDSSGNLIAQIEYTIDQVRLTPDGTFFYRDDNGTYIMYSSDWKTKTELPVLQAEVAHGLTKDVEFYTIMANYANKVYVYSYDSETRGYYCLNTDTMTWTAVESEISEIKADYYWNYSYTGYFNNIIGRYWFVSDLSITKIYDMETDTVIATVADKERFVFDYGDLEFKSGVLSRIKYPGDGSEAVTETILDTGDMYNNQKVFNEQYYVYKDQYGIFLREYGKGEDGEITVWMFEN